LISFVSFSELHENIFFELELAKLGPQLQVPWRFVADLNAELPQNIEDDELGFHQSEATADADPRSIP
jgi:hypothetical protein